MFSSRAHIPETRSLDEPKMCQTIFYHNCVIIWSVSFTADSVKTSFFRCDCVEYCTRWCDTGLVFDALFIVDVVQVWCF